MSAPVVFISYSHDSLAHKDRILAVSNRLRQDGVDCRIDQYEESPTEGWPLWCEKQIEQSAFVLVACTQTYLRRFRKEEARPVGLGVTWEGHIISQELYNGQGQNAKFIPIIFDVDDSSFIPLPLKAFTHYKLDENYDGLYRRLTNQPLIAKPSLGTIKTRLPREVLPPQPALERRDDFVSSQHAASKEQSPDILETKSETGHPSDAASNGLPRSWLTALKDLLVADFVAARGHPFEGYFSSPGSLAEAMRWHSPGGELIDHPTIPKRPYYETYWGYRAALRIAPEYVEKWRPITVEAIERHFGSNRWLQVMRDYSFSKGPTSKPRFVETVRHTARAAALLYMLEPTNRRVSETAWSLISESGDLQQLDGGWKEFRGTTETSSLWSTVYVFQFLSMLVASSQQDIPDERESFVEKADVLLAKTELFLIDGWGRNRWSDDPHLPWPEVAATVLTEVTPFFKDRAFVGKSYNALRGLVNPAGHLEENGITRAPDAPSEPIQALSIAIAMKSAGEHFFKGDARYHRLAKWVSEHLDLSNLSAHDAAFAAEVVDLNAGSPSLKF